MPARKSRAKTARKPRAKPQAIQRREALVAEAKQSDVSPLDYMLSVLNEPTPVREPKEPAEAFSARMYAYNERRMDAAKAAAPYVHAKPQASVKIESITPIEDKPVNVLELAKKVAFLFTMAQVRPTVDVTPAKLN